MAFSLGSSSVLIRSFIATGNSKGENVKFHLTYRQCFAQVNVTQSPPFHPEKLIVMLGINLILGDTTEVSLVIVCNATQRKLSQTRG